MKFKLAVTVQLDDTTVGPVTTVQVLDVQLDIKLR